MDALSLPRLLISQRISEYTKYTEQIELWNLSVLVTQPLSDTEIYDRINGSHNDLVGHHGVNRTMELVKSSPRIKQAIKNQGAVVLKLRQKVKKFIRSCPCCQKMNMDKIKSKAKPFTLSTFNPMQTLMIDYIEDLPKDDLDCRHIAVVVDCFSRYCTYMQREQRRQVSWHALSQVTLVFLAYLTTLSRTRVPPSRAMSSKTSCSSWAQPTIRP